MECPWCRVGGRIWKTDGRAAADGVNCTSGRNGRNKINAVEGVMLFFWYTVGNIINIPSIPCY